MKAKKGFTLVEILIVVVILGILAAIVIPQFTEASTEAKKSSLRSDLQTVRSQIELYKIQHNDNPPPGDTAAAFVTAMTTTVAYNGTNYGPYLQQMPKNPFNGSSDIKVTGDPGAGDQGWWYDAETGAFKANTPDHVGTEW